MKKWVGLLILLLGPCSLLWGQGIIGNGQVQYVWAAPAGACGQNNQQQDVVGAGTIWMCQNGTWAQVGGGGGAGGSSGQVQFNNSGAFGGDSTFTFNSTSKQVTAGYLATTTGPAIDPMAYGCAGDGSTDDTTCFQNAVNYMEANRGYITCAKPYKLNRVQLNGQDFIRGVGEGPGGCVIYPKTDAAFVPKTPTSYLGTVQITDMEFIGGSNPIDFPLINQADFERLEFFDVTGCGMALIDGERRYISQITDVHTGVNGFAALCTGDYTKSLFSGVIPPGPYGAARTVVDHLWELDTLGSLGFSAQWLWYGSDNSHVDSSSGGLAQDTIRDVGCFYGCTTGLLQFGTVENTTIDVVDTDHVGQSGTPEAIGFNINGCFQNSRVSSYTPNFNANYMTTEMFVGQFCDGSTIENSLFSSSVDNVTTFGLYITNSAPTGSLISVTGGVYNAGGAVGSQAPADMINVIGSRLVPSNLHGGAILGDQTNKDVEISLLHDTGTGTASTGLFKVMRAPGGFAALTPDLTSSGTLFQLNEALSVNGTLTDTTTNTFETFSQFFTAPWEGLQLTSAAGSVGSNIDLRNSTGTNASPLALLSGQELGALTFNGYNGSAFTTSAAAKINVKAGENWSTSAEGTSILFNSTPDTTTSAVTRGLVDGLGNWEFGAPGAGPLPTGTAYAEFDINGNLIKPESTAPSGIASSDILYADSTAHRWKMLNNNTSGLDLVGIASAGTSGNCLQLAANGIDISDSGSTNCGGGGAVSSVFTRTGAVVATSGDYTVAQVTGAAPLASPTFTGTVTLPSGQALIAPALGTPASGVLTNTSGYLWNNLAAPTGNLSLTMGSDTSIFNTTTALSQFFAWKNTTAAVVGTSQGSPILSDCGTAFHGSASVEDCMTFKELPGNGNDAPITQTIGHTGTSTGQVNTLFTGAIESGLANTNLVNGDISAAESSTTGSLKLGTDNGLEVRRNSGALEFNGANTIHAGGSTVSTDQAMTISGGFQSGGTKFTASGCSNSTTVGGATAGSFASGTTGACTVTITMGSSATATNGWACFASDQTTPANLYDQKTGGSTTTAVLSGTTVSGDVISFGCMAY